MKTIIFKASDANKNDSNAKMQPIADKISVLGDKIPCLQIKCNDVFGSSIYLSGSYDKKEDWINGIWENSRHFRFTIRPVGERLYTGGKVTVELIQRSKVGKFRKSTCTVDKCIERITNWIEENHKIIVE